MLRRIITRTTDWTDMPTIARCRVCGEIGRYDDMDIITPRNPTEAYGAEAIGCPHCLTGSRLDPTTQIVFYG